MKLQSNMMMFTRVAGIIYGLWFFFAPTSYFSLMLVPQELVNELGIGQTQQIGLALFRYCLVDLSHCVINYTRQLFRFYDDPRWRVGNICSWRFVPINYIWCGLWEKTRSSFRAWHL
jgi:hypothetical protein